MTERVGTPVDDAVEPLVSLARTLHAQGDPAGALEALEQAIALAPDRAELHCDMGQVWQEMDDQDAALGCFWRAVELAPDFIPARQNLGYLLFHHGEPEQALTQYEHALAVWPSPISHMLAATVLPVIYDSVSDLESWRKRLRDKVHELAVAGLRVDTSRSQIPTNFFLAYQGQNDREIAAEMGRIYQGLSMRSRGRAASPAKDRLRIGLLSAFFRDHTIGRLNLGRVQRLSRASFEVNVLALGQAHDEMAQAFACAADRFWPLPRNVEAARQAIADLDLDILLFADVGMDAIASTLVYSRMARVQCATWGHPDTTGSPSIDYFLSSGLLESLDGDSHYTEKLIRLPLPGVYYQRPVHSGPPRTRSYFGFAEDRHIYLCPQTLFKFHPEFDSVLAGILAADSRAELVLLEGRIRNWTERLKRRFWRSLPDASQRVRFLPAQPYNDFLSLLEIADVVLDPLHFGGGNTSYETLAMGTPIVTLPSPYLRGRITAALYLKMGFSDLIVKSNQQYIATAIQLAADPSFRQRMRQRINATNKVLFEDSQEVTALEDSLLSLE